MSRYILNLAPDFFPYVGGVDIPLEVFKFPGGETHIKIKSLRFDPTEETPTVIITHRIKNGDDVMAILLAKHVMCLILML